MPARPRMLQAIPGHADQESAGRAYEEDAAKPVHVEQSVLGWGTLDADAAEKRGDDGALGPGKLVDADE